MSDGKIFEWNEGDGMTVETIPIAIDVLSDLYKYEEEKANPTVPRQIEAIGQY